MTHWATFETAEPVGTPGGTVLTVKLNHFYAGGIYTLGRFRISVDPRREAGRPRPARGLPGRSSRPSPRSGPRPSATPCSPSTGRSTPSTASRLDALNASRAPLPADPQLEELRDRVESASKPLPLDPRLVQLRQDVEMSIKQATDRRLTAAQDIAWALINSPSFLFNH